MRSITSYLNKKLKSTQQTPDNKANPKMSIQVSRARTTIMDSDYWTVETIREKEELGDVSVAARRDRPYGPPNQIYEIHVDNGIVGTSIREYPDTLKGGWKDQFILGPGISVAIAFDGYWDRYRKLWRLITKEKPYIFWVDDKNILWRQHWDEEITKEQLSSDVAFVRAIRAWKNVNFADKDQGVVVGYIKTDGSVWYRNYCQQSDYSYMWENPRQITQFIGTANQLNLFITNDYRMGFVVSDNQHKISWYITGRNWAGMAIPSEKIAIHPETKVQLTKIQRKSLYIREYLKIGIAAEAIVLYSGTFYKFLKVENINNGEGNWGLFIVFTLQHQITNLTPSDFIMIDEMGRDFPCVKLTPMGYRKYQAEFMNFNNAIGELDIRCSGFETKNEVGGTIETFAEKFPPINLVAEEIHLPEVEAIWNE